MHKIKSSPGFSIWDKIKLVDLELRSFNLNLKSTIGIFELTIKYLLSWSIIFISVYNKFSFIFSVKSSTIIFSYILICWRKSLLISPALILIPLCFSKNIFIKWLFPENFSPIIFIKFLSHFGQLFISLKECSLLFET